jgi:hypothetical protein
LLEGHAVIGIDGLRHFLDALARIDLAPAQLGALAAEADQLAGAVRNSLSHPPGSDHATPWLRTGALQASIASQASESEAVVGSTDPVAVYQERGTRTVPPRPFLAPAGAAGAEDAARRIGRTIVDAIKEALR